VPAAPQIEGVVDVGAGEFMSFGIAVRRSDKSHPKRKQLRTPDHGSPNQPASSDHVG
jgi:hypothetical protein